MIQWRKIILFDFHHIPKLSIGFNFLNSCRETWRWTTLVPSTQPGLCFPTWRNRTRDVSSSYPPRLVSSVSMVTPHTVGQSSPSRVLPRPFRWRWVNQGGVLNHREGGGGLARGGVVTTVEPHCREVGYTGWPKKNATLTINDFKKTRNRMKNLCASLFV